MRQGTKFRFGTRGLFATMLVVALVSGAISLANRAYYAERYRVRSILNKIDGIDYTMLSHEDIFEKIGSVTITIDSIPDSQIVLLGLARYGKSGRFAISQIGKWRFVIQGTTYLGATDAKTGEPVKSNYWGGYIDAGRKGPYRDLIPYPTDTLQDIIDHYEELVEHFDSWPRESDPGRVVLDDGSLQKYYVISNTK